jgi:hypothetical protein
MELVANTTTINVPIISARNFLWSEVSLLTIFNKVRCKLPYPLSYLISNFSIAIEINPTNSTAGSATATTRKKGIIIRAGSELDQFNQLISNPKVVELAKKVEAVNTKNKEDTTASNRSGSNTDIFEI